MIDSGLMSRSFLPRVLSFIPPSVRRIVIGRSDQPSKVATALHHLFNRTKGDGSEVLACSGPLKGFRMSTDWARYRGYVYGSWEPIATDAIISAVKPGMRVFDIGAHLGYYSLLLARCVGPAGRVMSFEAAPRNFDTLRSNILINNLKNVDLFNLAVFSEVGSIQMSISSTDVASGDWSISRHSNGETIQVPTITLDQFYRETDVLPDFLKMDVEGAEYDVLVGGREVISRSRPTMLIELHHFDGDLAANRVPELLGRWNYQIRWLEKWPQTSQILAQPLPAKST